ncbi:hypothetical protein HK102_008434, partial [Quaeritorhiza haematococci]
QLGCIYTCMSTRMALQLRLDHPEEFRSLSWLDREVQNRTWYGCYILELALKLWSTEAGMICHQVDYMTVREPPSPEWLFDSVGPDGEDPPPELIRAGQDEVTPLEHFAYLLTLMTRCIKYLRLFESRPPMRGPSGSSASAPTPPPEASSNSQQPHQPHPHTPNPTFTTALHSLSPSSNTTTTCTTPNGPKPQAKPSCSGSETGLDRDHICTYCGSAFHRKNDLKRHIRSRHTGEKPFQCNRCGKRFGRSDTLKKHRETEDLQQLQHHQQLVALGLLDVAVSSPMMGGMALMGRASPVTVPSTAAAAQSYHQAYMTQHAWSHPPSPPPSPPQQIIPRVVRSSPVAPPSESAATFASLQQLSNVLDDAAAWSAVTAGLPGAVNTVSMSPMSVPVTTMSSMMNSANLVMPTPIPVSQAYVDAGFHMPMC